MLDVSFIVDVLMVCAVSVIGYLCRRIPAMDKLLHESCRRPCDDCSICPKQIK